MSAIRSLGLKGADGAAGSTGATGPAPSGAANDVVYLTGSAVAAARTLAAQITATLAATIAALGLPWTASAAPVTVQTTDATVTTLATFATTTSKHHALLLIVSAGQSDRSASVMWTRLLSVTNDAGTVTIRDNKELGPTNPATAWVVSLDVSGTSVRVRVTGVAATTIDWSCTVTSLVGGS